MQITDPDYSIVLFRSGPTTVYQWIAAGPNPCPRCAQLDGQVRSLSTWTASIVPGFHRHCHCKLVPINAADPGAVFTYQFCHLTLQDILDSITAMFVPLSPRFHTHHLFDEPDGASDIVPYQPTRAELIASITPEFDWSTAQPNED